MRAFVTGGTGFIGGRLVQRLRERGDEVVALVRSRDRAAELEQLGCQLVEGDIGSNDALRRGLDGVDAAFHAAAVYKVGIPKSAHAAMYEANVRGTERVLDAAFEAAVERIVYVSTVNVFGNTRGEVVDESYRRPQDGYLSYYDETKYLAHQAALERIAKGMPIVVVQPGGVYGPGDHSDLGNLIEQTRRGRLPLLPFPQLGLNFVYVDDVAAGIMLAHDSGQIGESYVLGGEVGTMTDFVGKVADISGRKPPRGALPTGVLKAIAPAGPVVGRMLGFGPNMRELISVSDGVTYWAKDDKARRELSYSPRGLESGLRETLSV
jgi:dihydroflavonol-4-reductase